jgi:hypothetical protein
LIDRNSEVTVSKINLNIMRIFLWYIQCSKWADMWWYTIPELLSVPEFNTGT